MLTLMGIGVESERASAQCRHDGAIITMGSDLPLACAARYASLTQLAKHVQMSVLVFENLHLCWS